MRFMHKTADTTGTCSVEQITEASDLPLTGERT